MSAKEFMITWSIDSIYVVLLLRTLIPYTCLFLSSLIPPHIPVYDKRMGVIRVFLSWDVEWFLRIAGGGYSTEARLAFFPALPFLLREIGIKGVLALNGVLRIINAVLQIKLCRHLNRLAGEAFTPQTIRKLHFLLIFSPIAVFETVPYTETLFGCLSVMFLLVYSSMTLYNKKVQVLGYVALVLIGMLMGLVRNTAVFHAGYFMFGVIFLSRPIGELILSGYYFLSVLLPLKRRLEQYYEMCIPLKNVSKIYSNIQNKYWGVGLFNYWKITNLPRFLLVLPSTFLCLSYMFTESKKWIHSVCRERNVFPRPTSFKFAVATHAFVLTSIVVFLANVEILPRILLSSCPSILTHVPFNRSTIYMVILISTLGAGLFGAFLPWT
ncbi:Glycosylphosphatidylinositol-alpha 1,6 mannosyltransferase 2 [Giardia duodenalis]|uniref:GPI mannosyltransferase 2 n=1 Tax=Giardia intestinalis TaxID=5741 RepID=V6TEX4_GIAIN|nr:Glycosylphosphatidylinositol-alpha 1,6 mannosyltransferase 2 [Giardia intestinalis]